MCPANGFFFHIFHIHTLQGGRRREFWLLFIIFFCTITNTNFYFFIPKGVGDRLLRLPPTGYAPELNGVKNACSERSLELRDAKVKCLAGKLWMVLRSV